jgi:hypothetical protein
MLHLSFLLACASTHSAADGAASPTEVGEASAEETTAASTEASTAAAEAPPPAAIERGPGLPLTALDGGRPPQPGASLPEGYGESYSLLEPPAIDGSTLTMKLRHGGGCAEHGWSLAPAGAAQRGQLTVQLVHDANGDLCKALLMEEVKLEVAAQGLDLCGVNYLLMMVAFGHEGEPQQAYKLEVPAALSACEGIVPEEAAPADQ